MVQHSDIHTGKWSPAQHAGPDQHECGASSPQEGHQISAAISMMHLRRRVVTGSAMRSESKVDVGKVTNYPVVRAGNCEYISHIQKEHRTKSREGKLLTVRTTQSDWRVFEGTKPLHNWTKTAAAA